MATTRTPLRRIGRGMLTALALAISLVFLLPVLWLLASTFRTSAETAASSSPLSWWVLWPRGNQLGIRWRDRQQPAGRDSHGHRRTRDQRDGRVRPCRHTV